MNSVATFESNIQIWNQEYLKRVLKLKSIIPTTYLDRSAALYFQRILGEYWKSVLEYKQYPLIFLKVNMTTCLDLSNWHVEISETC